MVDCAQLQADIDKLEQIRHAFEDSFDKANEDNDSLSIRNYKKIQAEANKLEDEVLQKYLENFTEHNPDLLTCFSFNKEVEDFGDYITDVIQLSDKEIFVRCYDEDDAGVARILRKGEDGEYAYGEMIEVFMMIYTQHYSFQMMRFCFAVSRGRRGFSVKEKTASLLLGVKTKALGSK